MVIDPKLFKTSPITFTHRIVEGFRDPAWRKLWPRLRVMQGDVMPTGYGIAWREHNRDAYIIMPVPLNLICNWSRELWWRLRVRWCFDTATKMEGHSFERARLIGRREGYGQGFNDGVACADRRRQD